MITIIKPGKDIFVATCHICDCVFRYEPEDIKRTDAGIGRVYKEFVECPNCSNRIIISPTIKTIEMAGEPVKC